MFFLGRGLDIGDCGEHENEFPVSIKGRSCLDPLITCHLVRQYLPLVNPQNSLQMAGRCDVGEGRNRVG